MKAGGLISRVLLPIAGTVLVVAAYRAYGGAGVALVVAALVMWFLLHFTRTLQVLQRTAQRPVGHVDSAVMLNARLRAGQSLLHVVAMTRALGALQGDKGTQPEVFRWTDQSQSHVTCEFVEGKLQRWSLVRPEPLDGP
ncbi:MAG: glycerate kinase [Rhodoferax sp.]|nr:glycerate kinase [Rhodoferax sp.]